MRIVYISNYKSLGCTVLVVQVETEPVSFIRYDETTKWIGYGFYVDDDMQKQLDAIYNENCGS